MYYSYTNLILKMVPLYNKFVYVNISYEIKIYIYLQTIFRLMLISTFASVTFQVI